MYRQIIIIITVILFGFASCNLGLVEEVQIIGTPEYQIPMGFQVLSDHFDIEQLLAADDLGLDVQVKTGTKVINGVTTTYSFLEVSEELFAVNLSEFADFTSFLNLNDISFGNLDFSAISIPTVDSAIDVPITMDMSSILSLDYSPGALSIPFTELGNVIPVLFNAEIESKLDSEDGLSSVTFEEGVLTLELSFQDTTTAEVDFSSVHLIDNDLNEIPGVFSDTIRTLTSNNVITITFDLDGRSLPNEFKMVFEGTVQGGTEGVSNPINITASLINPSIAAVAGITLGESFSPVAPVQFPTDMIPEELVYAEIDTGTITIDITIPNEWEQVSLVETTFALIHTQGGTETRKIFSTTDDKTFTLDLNGLEIGEGIDLELDYEIKLTGLNATVTNNPADILSTITITHFSTVTVSKPGLAMSQDITVDAAFLDYVKKITFAGVEPQLLIEISNQLPFGVTIEAASTLFMGETPETLTFPKQTQTALGAPLKGEVDFTDQSALDPLQLFSITAYPEGYDTGTSTFTMEDVGTGGLYDFEITSVDIADIESVTVAIEQAEQIENAFDFSFLSGMIPAGVDIKDVKATAAFEGIENFTGTIVLLAKDAGNEISVLLGSKIDVLEQDVFDTTKYEGIPISHDAPAEFILDELIQARAEQVSLAYAIKFTEAVLELEDHGDQLALKVILNIMMPMHFEVTAEDGVLIDLENDGGDLFKLTEDLLGRSADGGEINDLLQQVGRLTLEFDLVNEIGISPELRITDNAFAKTIDFSTGTHEIVIEGDDIDHIIATNPFMPEAFIWLKQGEHVIFHEGDLILRARVIIGMDIDYKIPLTK